MAGQNVQKVEGGPLAKRTRPFTSAFLSLGCEMLDPE